METKARYTLIGLFTLLVIGGIFAFVYWLHHTGGIGRRAEYRVLFQGSVSGLLAGSNVLFNGVRVGEVRSLELDSDKPTNVMATIAIDAATPVRSDTAVSMDFQGLTGAPVIVLSGGSPSAPQLQPADGQPPLLQALPDAGTTLSQSARDALGRFDKLVGENSEPLHDAIVNIKTFAEALSRNSGHVDGIMAGLERMTGGAAAKAASTIFTFDVPPDIKKCAHANEAQITVPEPVGLMSLNSDQIPVLGSQDAAKSYKTGSFSDAIPSLLQVKIIEALENSHCFKSVARVIESVEPDVQLVFDIRKFGVAGGPAPSADIDLSAKVAQKGAITASQVFRQHVPLASADAAGAAAALNQGFGKIARDLVPWVAQATAAHAQPDDAGP
ncbi:MAG TPA: ABC-type transport auxiliary lipoprotein family protein [Hyphomicrobium sp.]|nr:ABC-type transport auxiliary lipoprotein family protein [Hyphomicrobium sp.]